LFQSPPTSPDGIVIADVENLSRSVGGASVFAGNSKPKRQSSLIDRFRFGPASPKLGTKKFRGPTASPAARRKYISHDDGVDMLPTVEEGSSVFYYVVCIAWLKLPKEAHANVDPYTIDLSRVVS
jgi:hypothetical protein